MVSIKISEAKKYCKKGKEMKSRQENHNGSFTLAELLIATIIIGFLMAGVAAGTNMIKQAELRSVITDFQSYNTAYNNFLAKYNKIPGDMETASTYWSNNECADNDNLCNGNNNGIIDLTTDGRNEVNKAWKHLSLAGMVNKRIERISSLNIRSAKIGVTVPASKMAAGGYILIGGPDAAPFKTFNNAVFLGREKANASLLNSAITPEDAFSIDQKIDDGTVTSDNTFMGAVTGRVRSKDGDDATILGCVSDVTKGKYNIGNKKVVCRIGMSVN